MLNINDYQNVESSVWKVWYDSPCCVDCHLHPRQLAATAEIRIHDGKGSIFSFEISSINKTLTGICLLTFWGDVEKGLSPISSSKRTVAYNHVTTTVDVSHLKLLEHLKGSTRSVFCLTADYRVGITKAGNLIISFSEAGKSVLAIDNILSIGVDDNNRISQIEINMIEYDLTAHFQSYK